MGDWELPQGVHMCLREVLAPFFSFVAQTTDVVLS